MSDTPPSDEPGAEPSEGEENLAERLLQLEQEHRELDEKIREIYDFPYRDQLLLQRLKKKKLLLKDMITRIKDDLIPDLNA